MRKPELSEKDDKMFDSLLNLLKDNEAAIEHLQDAGDSIKDSLKKFCPYKIGNKIEFELRWDKGKARQGQIERIHFDKEGIDGLWSIEVRPLAKNFSKLKRVVVHAQNLEENDRILKIIS